MEKALQPYIFAFVNLAAFIAVLTINALANILPLNGIGTGDVSDLYPNLFAPAGLTFSIWGVIYLLLAGFCIYGIVSIFKTSIDSSFLSEISIWFIISSLANFGWIFAWHWKKIGLSLLLMAVILASLIIIYMKLGRTEETSRTALFFTRLPFSIYLGWITVATIANITTFLVSLNLDSYGLSEVRWTIIVIAAAAVITGLIIMTRKDIGYSIVVVWALTGIIMKRSEANDARAVVIAAIAAIVVIAGLLILKLVKSVSG